MPDAYAPVLTVDLGAIVANYRLLSGRVGPAACGAASAASTKSAASARTTRAR